MPELTGPLEAVAPIAGRLADASLGPLALGLCLQLLKLAALSRVWHRVLAAAYPRVELRARDTLAVVVAGAGINAVVPAKAGVVARTALAKRRIPGATYDTLAGTVLLDSALVAVPPAVLLVVAAGIGLLPAPLAAFSSPSPSFPLAHGGALIAAIAATAVLAICVTVRLGRTARVRELAGRARQGVAILARGGMMARALAWATAACVLRLAIIACFLTAFHLAAGPRVILAVVLVQTLASLVPVTPNGAGTQQGLMVLALGAFASSAAILAFSVGMQAAIGALDLVAGGIVMAGPAMRRARRRPAPVARSLPSTAGSR